MIADERTSATIVSCVASVSPSEPDTLNQGNVHYLEDRIKTRDTTAA